MAKYTIECPTRSKYTGAKAELFEVKASRKLLFFISFLFLFLLVLCRANAETQNALWFMDDLYITQLPGGDYSHAGTLNFDVIGVNNRNIKAPFDCEIVKVYPGYDTGNTVIIQSVTPVQFANGSIGYMSLAFGHDNDISDCYVGRKLYQGEVFCQNGNYGNVTGIHSHVTVIRGKYTDNPGWIKVSTGNYTFNNAIHPCEALFISDHTNVIDTKGLSFKKSVISHTSIPTVFVSSFGLHADVSWNDVGASSYYVYIQNQLSGDIPYGENIGKQCSAHFMLAEGNYKVFVTASYSESLTATGSASFRTEKLRASVDRGMDGIYNVNDSVTMSLNTSYFDTCSLSVYRTPNGGETYKYWEYPINTSSYTLTFPDDGYYCCCFTVKKGSYTIESEWVAWSVVDSSPAIQPGLDWQEVSVIPGSIDLSTCEVEYNNHYTTTATTSPGSGWVRGAGSTAYVKSGSPYQTIDNLATSNTLRQEGFGYFHYCGGSTGARANYFMDNQYVHWDSVDPNLVNIKSTVPDDDNPSVIAYRLTWKSDGSDVYCQSGVTCDGSNGSHGKRSMGWYRMYYYQDYTAVTNYTWTKDSGWTTQKDPAASSVTYRFRLKRYTVSFDANGGEAAPQSLIKYHSVSLQLPYDIPTRNGYDFYSWNTERDGSGTMYIPGTTYVDNSDRTFYARWTLLTPRFILPALLTDIEEEAFAGIGADIIEIPDGCISIESRAFADNEGLERIIIPSSVIYISPDTFENCPNVTIVSSRGSWAVLFAQTYGLPYEITN